MPETTTRFTEQWCVEAIEARLRAELEANIPKKVWAAVVGGFLIGTVFGIPLGSVFFR